MKRLAIAVCAVSMLAACAEGPSRNVWTGAAAGAILGAGAGTLAGGDDGRNAAIGAAVGAIAGAAVGDYMDKQNAPCANRLPAPVSVLSVRATRLP